MDGHTVYTQAVRHLPPESNRVLVMAPHEAKALLDLVVEHNKRHREQMVDLETSLRDLYVGVDSLT